MQTLRLHPIAHEVINKLLDRVDRQPIEDRSRQVQFKLTRKTLPSLFALQDSEDRELAWAAILHLQEKHGWLQVVMPQKLGVGKAGYEQSPSLRLVAEAEEEIRTTLDRPRPGDSYAAEWRRMIEQLKGEGTDALARCPIVIPNRSLELIWERVSYLLTVKGEFYAREASAMAFWGNSKVLDSDVRLAAINAARDQSLPPIRPAPLLLNIALPVDGKPDRLLFIENESSYHRARTCLSSLPGGRYALVWSAGFKGASSRMTDARSVVLHFDRDSESDAARWVCNRLQDGDCPIAFFGDLDFAGLGILKSIKRVYPTVTAWIPGYESLLWMLKNGGSHQSEEMKKTGQTDPGETGCPYADEMLRPALLVLKKFVDQEAHLFHH